jgi:hypothetical protein
MNETKKACLRKFPTFPLIFLVLGVLWLLSDLKVIKINIPWFPVVLIVIALGWIINHYLNRD